VINLRSIKKVKLNLLLWCYFVWWFEDKKVLQCGLGKINDLSFIIR